MTYYGAKEMAASFRTVRSNTIKIAEEIPEEQYGFRPAAESRSVAEALVHMANGTKLQEKIHGERMKTLVGFDFFGYHGALMADEKTPRSKAQIVELLRTQGEKFATFLEGMSEGVLAEQVQYPEGMTPPSKSRFEMLLAPKEHEMHHRAQLMVIQRMIGITPHLTRQMQERAEAMRAAGTAQAAR